MPVRSAAPLRGAKAVLELPDGPTGPAGRHLRIFAGALLLAVAVGMLAWGMWPPRHHTETLWIRSTDALPPRPVGTSEAAGARGAAEAHENYSVTLQYPPVVRAGDAELVHLRLTQAPAPAPGLSGQWMGAPLRSGELGGSGGLPEHVFAEARLELDGAQVRPDAEVTVPLPADGTLDFVWSVRLDRPHAVRGTAWLFLIFTQIPSHTEDRVAVSAQAVEIRAAGLAGLSGSAARVGGSLALIAGVALLMSCLPSFQG